MKANLYDEVTNSIIAQLESGVAPWVKPWSVDKARRIGGINSLMPHNYTTGRAYSGVNVLLLWTAAAKNGWDQPAFLTYKQAQAAGGNVRKGSKSTTVYYFGSGVTEKPNGDLKAFRYLKSFSVFNVAQCENLKAVKHDRLDDVELSDAEFKAFVAATGADIRSGGDRAFYTPALDYIQMPPVGAFKSESDFKSTELHELTHWTGAKHRLARNFSGRFGNDAYAAEELVAELGAAFLCAQLGVEGKLQHPEYIGHWLKVLRGDNKAIFTAASQASKAADLIMSTAPARAKASSTALVVYVPPRVQLPALAVAA